MSWSSVDHRREEETWSGPPGVTGTLEYFRIPLYWYDLLKGILSSLLNRILYETGFLLTRGKNSRSTQVLSVLLIVEIRVVILVSL